MAETANEYDFLFKVNILGESGVGKTMIWNRYCEGHFYYDKCTIGVELKGRTIDVNGKRVKLQIWDTCGQERFRAISRTYYRGTMGVLLCYSITNRESFEKVEYWLEEVKKNATEKDICIVLVGTKSDLLNERVVSIDEGRQKAELHGMRFFETSAKENLNIDETFLTLAKGISVVFAKKENDTQLESVAGARLHSRENNPQIQINCFKCS